MIYLNNNTLLQDVYIPRQDMLPYTTGSSGTYAEGYSDGYEDGTQDQKDKLASTAFTENGLYTREDGWNEVEVSVEAPLPVLEDKTVVISADTTTVTPSSGYDGMSQVIVDASEYAQENYDGGFEDGFEDGYSSGSTDEKAKLSGITFTANTAVTLSDGGYSAVTVNVPQTGSSIPLSSITLTANTAISVSDKAYTGITVNVDTASTYNSGYTDGYDSGYTSGETHQKSLLVSTAFTENGEYQRENGWSGVTVNIDTASTWTDGYSSGETHQKSLLTTTAITVNGNYTRENGWSGITVNVPTGSSYNVEQNKPFTATSNGNYTITPSSGITTVTDRFDSDSGRYYLTATTSGYPSTGYFKLFLIEDEFDSSKGSIEVYFDDGSLDYDDSDWYGGEVDWDGYGNNELEVVIYDANRDFDWTPLEDFRHNFDVMSAVSLNVNVDTASTYQSGYTDGQDSIINTFSSMTATTNGVYGSSAHPLSSITVNVPQSGGSGTTKIFFADYIHTDTLQADSRDRINTGIYPTTATTFRVKGLGKGLSAGYELVGFDLNDAGEESDYRLFCYSTSGEILGFDWYSERITNENWGGLTDGKGIDFTCSNYQVYDNINETVLISGSPQSNMAQGVPIYVNVASWWLKGLEIWEGNTKVFDGVAAYDENGNVGLYDSVSNALVTNENLTLVYENVDEYQYGFNDGQNSIINTFSSMTVTTNGVYGTSAHPLSSITVNVPQSGSNNIFFADYIHTETIPTNDAEINTGIYASTDISIRIKCLGKGYQVGERGDNIFGFGPNEGASDGNDFRLMCYDNNTVLAYDWRSARIYTPYSGLYDGREIDYTCGNYYVYDNIEQEYLITGNTQSYVNESVPIYVNVGKIWLKSFEIWKGQTKVFDGKAAYDSAGNIGLYDSVSNELVYSSDLSMVYEIISPSDYYNSGYTSGYTDGSNDEKALLSAITFTANTAITVNSGGYSAITVDVDVIKIIPVSSIHHSDIGDGKNYFLDTGIYPTTATTVRVKGVGAGYYPNNGFVYAEVNKSSVSDSDWMLSIQQDVNPENNLLGFSIKSRKRTIEEWGEPSVGRQIDVTCNDFGMIDNISQSSVTASTLSFTSSGTLKVNVGCWWLKGIQIWEASELVFDGIAAYDENGHIGLYDNISGILVYNPDYTMVYENPVLGNVTLTANGIYNASNFGTEGFSAVTVNVDDNYGELIGLYCTNNCQFVLSYKQYLENTSIEFGIRTGGASINITSGATAPSVNRIEVDSNGNVTGHSYSSAGGAGAYATGSGQTSVVLDAFPTKNYMLIDTDTKNTTKVNGLSASTCLNYSSTPANNLLLSIDDGYFYGGAINNTGSDFQSCIFPHVDSDGNACILGSYGLFYPISGECYPIYKNGNNYYVLMKSQPWNQQ